MNIEFVRADGNDYVVTEITSRDPSCRDCDFYGDCPFEDCPLRWEQIFKKKEVQNV